MEQINASYDGKSIRFDKMSDELAFRDEILKTIRSFTNCRAKFLIEQRHLPAAIWAVDVLRQFTGAYTNHGLLAVAKKCIALERQLYVLMPSPVGNQSHWCKKIELLLIISKSILTDETYYLHRNRQQQNARPNQSPQA